MSEPSAALQSHSARPPQEANPREVDRNTQTAPEVVQFILSLFHDGGRSIYAGERVTQIEHALQCAGQAERCGAHRSLVVAALLHDLGHLLQSSPPGASSNSIDDLHEERAAEWLGRHFGPEVVEPVRLHVAAKRFLCATDPVYFARLSSASQLSLKLQGGPMSTNEVGKFLAHPHYREAVMLRRWDDESKVVGLATKPIDHYLPAILECVR